MTVRQIAFVNAQRLWTLNLYWCLWEVIIEKKQGNQHYAGHWFSILFWSYRSFKGFGYGNNGLAQYGMSALKQENHFAEELKHLIELLQRDNRDVKGSRFYTAEFQRQWVFAERHNEVAIPRA